MLEGVPYLAYRKDDWLFLWQGPGYVITVHEDNGQIPAGGLADWKHSINWPQEIAGGEPAGSEALAALPLGELLVSFKARIDKWLADRDNPSPVERVADRVGETDLGRYLGYQGRTNVAEQMIKDGMDKLDDPEFRDMALATARSLGYVFPKEILDGATDGMLALIAEKAKAEKLVEHGRGAIPGPKLPKRGPRKPIPVPDM